MTISAKFFLATLKFALGLGFSFVAFVAASALTQSENRTWELNASHLQAAGLHFPPDMPSVGSVMKYQVNQSTHQELTLEWNLIPDTESPVLRERVVEGTLAPDFHLLERKQNVKGNARTSTLTLGDMVLVTAAITGQAKYEDWLLGLALPGCPRSRSAAHR